MNKRKSVADAKHRAKNKKYDEKRKALRLTGVTPRTGTRRVRVGGGSRTAGAAG